MSNQNIEVYIDDYKVDIDTLASISIKKQLRDIKEFSKRKTSFSKPLNVLYTKHNASLFGTAFNINTIGGWALNSRPPARIVINNNTIIEGFAKLSKIDNKGYSFVVYEESNNLDVLFGDELIRGNEDTSKDIVMSNNYPFDFTRPNLRVLFNAEPRADGKGINYAWGDLLGESESNRAQWDHLMIPSLASREILEEVISSIGKTITFSTEIEHRLNKMYMPFNGEYMSLTSEWLYASYHAIEEEIDASTQWSELSLFKGLACDYDKISDRRADTDNVRKSIDVVNNVGKYKVKFNLNIKKHTDNGHSVDVFPKITLRTTNLTPYRSEELKLINVTNSLDLNSVNDPITLTGAGYVSGIFEAEFELKGGGSFLVFGLDTNLLEDGEERILSDTNGGTYIQLIKIDSYYNSDNPIEINANKILPFEYKKKDIFNDIITMFNAVVVESNNNLHLSTIAEYKSDDPVTHNWSDKINLESISLQTLEAAGAELLEFEMGQSSDIHCNDYRDIYDRGINDKKRLSSSKSIKTKSTVCAATVCFGPDFGSFARLSNNDSKYNTKLEPRHLFVDSGNFAIRFGHEIVSGYIDTSITHFHYLTTRFVDDKNDTDNLILAFNNNASYARTELNATETSATLYNRYHKVDELASNSSELMLLTAYFNLTNKDIADIKFNDEVFVHTQKFGSNYYRLNELTYSSNSNKLTKVELIQIDRGIESTNIDGFKENVPKINLSAEAQEKINKLYLTLQ